MFGADWNEGCKAYSLMAENYDGVVLHLKQLEVSLVPISRAPLGRPFFSGIAWGGDLIGHPASVQTSMLISMSVLPPSKSWVRFTKIII